MKNKIDRYDIPQLFLPHYVEGFYRNGIEISVDLDESDFAIIEDDSGVISRDECLKLLEISEQ